ncbi:PREDICTED: tripartite motif-containing protein 35 [Tinamus guttatus]|uniref:tripartite motif-containing protein 35 n=1 Tax=Tinamus guttatus TaxID=94827 RepID=UPI00052ED8AF|nr:PREDICTED: tripartite motif-containing protein 35 [Tinamus guttatus]
MEKGSSPPPGGSAALAPSSTATFKEELLCPICYEPFREAVTLGCGHNFCKGCVSRSWEHRPHVCPVCKEASSLDELRVNHTLNNLVEMILKEEGQRRGRAAALCALHREEAKLFCLDDKELACFGCKSAHKNRKRRIACTAEEPEAVPTGMLIDVAKYLGSLQYDVWKKMLDTITVVPFSFDPNSEADLAIPAPCGASGAGGTPRGFSQDDPGSG